MSKYKLKLYVTGKTPRSKRAVLNLRQICKDDLGDECEMVVIDVLDSPQLAKEDKILATPTLIKEFPQPICRIIGDLSNREKVLTGLGIKPINQK